LGLTHAHVHGDSELLMRHMTGVYKVQEERLKNQYLQARELTSTMHCQWVHRPREYNQAADFLSKIAPDNQVSYTNLDQDHKLHEIEHQDLMVLLAKDRAYR
jgi:ribonuclease HI